MADLRNKGCRIGRGMNGKDVCEVLRGIRVKFAKEHGIDYTPRACDHQGDCIGTCPACEHEVEMIMKEISTWSV